MDGELEPLGKYQKAWTFFDVLFFVVSTLLTAQFLFGFISGFSLQSIALAAVGIGGALIYRLLPRSQRPRGVFLDGPEVVVCQSRGDVRIPLAEAVVTHTTTRNTVDAGEHQWTSHDLSITHPHGSVPIEITGMTPANIVRYSDQLSADITNARWRYRLPEPNVN